MIYAPSMMDELRFGMISYALSFVGTCDRRGGLCKVWCRKLTSGLKSSAVFLLRP